MLMANWSINRLVEPKLMELFGSRIDELLPDRDINDFALNWDAAANQCVLYIRRATSDWYRDGAALHADALTAIARILATEAASHSTPLLQCSIAYCRMDSASM
jgi:hypothetical protein